MMDEFHKHYAALFNGVTDALEDLKQLNYGQAEARLRRAQQDAENAFMAIWAEDVRQLEGIDITDVEPGSP